MLWIPIGCRFRHFFSSSKVLLKSLSCGRKGGTLSSNRLQLMDFSNRTILDDSASNCEGKVVAAARRLLQKPQISSHCKESLFLIKETVTEIETISKTINDLTMLMKEANGDEEMMKLAKKELEENEASLRNMEHKILNLLLPHDEMNDSNIILEITAGIGGQEAMLFADDVFNMYFNFIQNNNWHIISCFTDKNTTAGGLRHGSINVGGSQVYQILKYEGGIHRVQRVPKTERSGRIHTSTVSVAVLPQPTEIQVSIKENEIKIETKRASGAGGQHVNTTDSAVRITHFPTGIVVENQTERSQIRNKELALKRLRGLIYEQQLEKQLTQQKLKRKLQVGTSARSEKIRTYNFIQDRVTDHRIGLTVHNLEDFMKGGQTLGFMVESLQVSACEENLQLLMET